MDRSTLGVCPPEILAYVADMLPLEALVNLAGTCRLLREIAYDPVVLRTPRQTPRNWIETWRKLWAPPAQRKSDTAQIPNSSQALIRAKWMCSVDPKLRQPTILLSIAGWNALINEPYVDFTVPNYPLNETRTLYVDYLRRDRKCVEDMLLHLHFEYDVDFRGVFPLIVGAGWTRLALIYVQEDASIILRSPPESIAPFNARSHITIDHDGSLVAMCSPTHARERNANLEAVRGNPVWLRGVRINRARWLIGAVVAYDDEAAHALLAHFTTVATELEGNSSCLWTYHAINRLHPRFVGYFYLPLHYACAGGAIGQVRTLLNSEGVRHNLDKRLRNSHNLKNFTPLQIACRRGFMDIAMLLVESGASLDCAAAMDRTILHYLALRPSGSLDLCAGLIEAATQAGVLIDRPDAIGLTALHLAVQDKHTEAICLLLKSGATVDIPDHMGRTALAHACCLGYTEQAEVLLDAGASTEYPDGNGETPLLLACRTGNSIRLVRLLCERGAVRSVINHQGETVLHLIAYKREVEYLLQFPDVLQLVQARTHDGLTPLMSQVDITHDYTRSKIMTALMANGRAATLLANTTPGGTLPYISRQ